MSARSRSLVRRGVFAQPGGTPPAPPPPPKAARRPTAEDIAEAHKQRLAGSKEAINVLVMRIMEDRLAREDKAAADKAVAEAADKAVLEATEKARAAKEAAEQSAAAVAPNKAPKAEPVDKAPETPPAA